MEVGAEVIGDKQLLKVFNDLSGINPADLFMAELKKAGDQLVIATKNAAPVSTSGGRSRKYQSRQHLPGTLRSSIARKAAGMKFPTIFGGPGRKNRMDAWYSHIVIGGHEYGGTRVAPNPFVRRAWDASEGLIKSSVARRIEEKIKKLVGK